MNGDFVAGPTWKSFVQPIKFQISYWMDQRRLSIFELRMGREFTYVGLTTKSCSWKDIKKVARSLWITLYLGCIKLQLVNPLWAFRSSWFLKHKVVLNDWYLNNIKPYFCCNTLYLNLAEFMLVALELSICLIKYWALVQIS